MPCRRFGGQQRIFRFSEPTLNIYHHFLLDDTTDTLLDVSVPLVVAEVASCTAVGAIYAPFPRFSKNASGVFFL